MGHVLIRVDPPPPPSANWGLFKYSKFFELPEQYSKVKTPWLAFPLVIKKNKFFKRKDMQIFFEKNKIKTKTILTGN